MKSVEQIAETIPVHQIVKIAVFYVIGKYSENDIKAKAREAQVPLPTFMEAMECLAWTLCEAVRNRCSVDKFREFIAEMEFLNTPEVLQVYGDSIDTIRQCLIQVSPNSEHFISLDWRVQVEFARRSLRQFKRPHVVMNLKTTNGNTTLESTPAMLCQLHDELDEALQSCRTAQFRRVQRFVK
ncbi:COMM domain-containing protein 2 [Histomonas meleagridis]|uniref:COMM domain-containing protein 2 n=1 Tax=Histomonas meleagridis TaxID=135588 RepID=UPI003559615F|nr:COMM domain-containing protein 2 [Histomonas meleagridis]